MGRLCADADEDEMVKKVYAVYCHDGDEAVLEGGSDLYFKYSRDDENVDAHYYAIYAVPVVPKPVPKPMPMPLKPVATLSLSKFPVSMGFARIGPFIYMLGGLWKSAPSPEVYIIDTRTLSISDNPNPIELDPGMVLRGPRLKTCKSCPIVVTLLGKIFAIPFFFNPQFWEEEGYCAEFLDSNSNQWVSIPNPQHHRRYLNAHKSLLFDVKTCYVVGSFIVVEINDGPVYELDATDPLLQGWKETTAYDIASPSPGVIAAKIYRGERMVLDIGDGQAAIFRPGIIRAQSLKLHFFLDIVNKSESDEDEGAGGELVNHLDYEIGKVNSRYGCLCCCFPMLGSSKAPSITWYRDTIAHSRFKKLMNIPYKPRYY